MKTKLAFLILVFAGFSMMSKLNAQQGMNLFKSKSGIIEYEYSGKSIGNETVYFDNHGNREARFKQTKTKMLGMTSEENTLTLRLDTVIYSIDLVEKTGTRQVISIDVSKMSKEEIKEWEEWGRQMREDLGFEKTGEEQVLGRNCEIWEGMGSKIWVWENMTLKSEVNLMGQWITEAKKIDLNVKIDPDKFKIPDGIQIQDLGEVITEEQLDSVKSTTLDEDFKKSIEDLKGILGVKKKK